jgi:pantoate--beta-alanine ligase
MKKITNPVQFQKQMEKLRLKGLQIGFVPTMGALHEGHLSLVKKARRENDVVAASIFVNPLQFGPKEDLSKYPRTLAADSKLLQKAGADYLFSPNALDFYPEDFSTSVNLKKLTGNLCGRFRPGHFEGVTTVVAKLFNLTKPHRVYFGAKDFQQAAVIRRMIRDLSMDIEFRLCETVREKDGLAMSSRNRYLNPADRKRAGAISQVLFELREKVRSGKTDLKQLQAEAVRKLKGTVDQVQYFEIVDPETLEPLRAKQKNMLAAAACFVGKTRLIDNVIITSS